MNLFTLIYIFVSLSSPWEGVEAGKKIRVPGRGNNKVKTVKKNRRTQAPVMTPTPGPTVRPNPTTAPFPTNLTVTTPITNPTSAPFVNLVLPPGPVVGQTPGPTPGPTPSPTPGPTPSPTPGPTPSPIPGPTPGPTPSPTPGPTPSPATNCGTEVSEAILVKSDNTIFTSSILSGARASYRVEGTGSTLVASMCGPKTVWDSELFIYSCDETHGLKEIASDNDGCEDSIFSETIWSTEVGQDYFVFVMGVAGSAGAFDLRVFPGAQRCAIATDGATVVSSDNAPAIGTIVSGGRVLYRVEGTGSSLIASTCRSKAEWYSQLVVYSCNETDGLKEIVSSPLSGCDGSDHSQTTWSTEVGQDYYVSVKGYFKGSAGAFELRIFPVAERCAIETDGATLVSSDNKPVNSSIEPGGRVLYRVEGTGSSLTASTCRSKAEWDSQLVVYSCNETDGLKEIVSSPITGCDGSFHSQTSWSTEVGQDYYVSVKGYFKDSAGAFELRVFPVAERCAIETDGATLVSSDNKPVNSTIEPGGRVFYRVEGTGSSLVASTCRSKAEWFSRLVVYSCNETDGLKEIAKGDDGCDGSFHSQTSWLTEVGRDYFVLVKGAIEDSGGAFELRVFPVAERCAIETDGASLVLSDYTPVSSSIEPGGRVFYRVEGTGSSLVASTCRSNDVWDSELVVYSCDETNGLKKIVSGDDGCEDGKFSETTWSTEVGRDYYVLLKGAIEDCGGAYELRVFPVAERCAIETDGASFVPSDNTPVSSTIEWGGRVFYRVEGTGSTLMASTCRSNDEWDSKLFVYSCDESNGLQEIVSDDNGCDGSSFLSRTSWSTEVGRDYYVLVKGAFEDSGGAFALRVFPVAERCAGETDGAPLVSSDNMPVSSIIESGRRVFYRVEGTGSSLMASTCRSDDEWDSQLVVYSCDETNGLQEIVSNDNGCDGSFHSRTNWSTEVGRDYIVLVKGAAKDSAGVFELRVFPVAERCAIETDGASVVSSDNKPVNSTIEPGGRVLYRVEGTGSSLVASTCRSKAEWNSYLFVYSCDDIKGLQEIASDDNGCDGSDHSQASWLTEVGRDYFVLVKGAFDDSGGAFELRVFPVAERCAIETDGASLVLSDYTPVSSTIASGGRVFYRVEGTGSVLVASTCRSKAEWDSELVVYSCDETNGLQEFLGSDEIDCDGSSLSQISWLTEVGRDYFVLVKGAAQDSTGAYELRVFPVAERCAIETDSASLVPSDNTPVSSTIESGGRVFYRVEGTGSTLVASTCRSNGTWDSKLFVYSCSDTYGLQEIVSDDNGCDGSSFSETSWSTEVRRDYYVLVKGASEDIAGAFELRVFPAAI